VIFTKDGQLELEDFYDFGEDDEGWEDVDDTGESTGDGSAAGASKALMIQSDSTKAKGDYELDLFRGAKKPTTVDVRHPTLSCARSLGGSVCMLTLRTHIGGFFLAGIDLRNCAAIGGTCGAPLAETLLPPELRHGG
jgi:hypothetical protein